MALFAISSARQAPPAMAAPRPSVADDAALLRAAAEVARELGLAQARVYWPDMLGSALVGYAALAGAICSSNAWLALACAVLAVLALYRALLFIHELTHYHRTALPGFRLAWNIIVGIPMLMPSLMYENVHTLHHARTRYGTAEDPEYLPLALMRPATLAGFIVVAALLPVGLLLRSALLVPLGAVLPPLGRVVWARASALAINPAFRRRPAEGAFRRQVLWQEIGTSVWAWLLLIGTAWLGWRPLAIALGVLSGVALLNQLRTLVAHLWSNEGEAMSVTAQFLDSVNVPPPGLLAALWAPVGLRYHATHHLLPSVPYHGLGEAHRRLAARFGAEETYHRASFAGLLVLIRRLVGSAALAGRRPAYSSVLTSTVSPIAQNSKKGAQAATSGG